MVSSGFTSSSRREEGALVCNRILLGGVAGTREEAALGFDAAAAAARDFGAAAPPDEEGRGKGRGAGFSIFLSCWGCWGCCFWCLRCLFPNRSFLSGTMGSVSSTLGFFSMEAKMEALAMEASARDGGDFLLALLVTIYRRC